MPIIPPNSSKRPWSIHLHHWLPVLHKLKPFFYFQSSIQYILGTCNDSTPTWCVLVRLFFGNLWLVFWTLELVFGTLWIRILDFLAGFRDSRARILDFLACFWNSRARIRDSLAALRDSLAALRDSLVALRDSRLSIPAHGISGLAACTSIQCNCCSGLSARISCIQLIWTFCAYFSLWRHIVTLYSVESTSISSSSTTHHRRSTCARRSCTWTRRAAAGSLCGALGRNPARRRWRQRGISAAAISSDSSAAISSDYSSTNSCNSPSLSFAFTAGRAAILKDFRFFFKKFPHCYLSCFQHPCEFCDSFVAVQESCLAQLVNLLPLPQSHDF